MSADDDSEAEGGEKKEYSFLIRFAVFAFIAGPASVFGFGLYGRVGLQNALTAAEKGDYSPAAILGLWILGLIGTAVMVFKK
ncbi:MAG: hypothetical protein JNL92_15980 [Opitutaceae bacterium]|nr:hypothetical protein [Opitutaceae bacterium]